MTQWAKFQAPKLPPSQGRGKGKRRPTDPPVIPVRPPKIIRTFTRIFDEDAQRKGKRS